MLRTLATAALLVPLLVPGSANARDHDISVQVPYSDLDLSRPNDARVLATRLQDAATSVCLQENPEANVPDSAIQACIDSSVRTAMWRIESNMDGVVRDQLGNVRSAMKEF